MKGDNYTEIVKIHFDVIFKKNRYDLACLVKIELDLSCKFLSNTVHVYFTNLFKQYCRSGDEMFSHPIIYCVHFLYFRIGKYYLVIFLFVYFFNLYFIYPLSLIYYFNIFFISLIFA